MKFYNKNLLLGLILFILLSVFQVKAQIVDLSTHVNNSLAPSGTNISWYTVSNPDPNNPNTNLVGSYTSSVVTSVNVTATSTATNYYVFFYDSVNKCFSPGSKITVITNTCPSDTVNLSAISVSAAPSGAPLEWHTSSTPTAANKVSSPNSVGSGTYWPVYYDSTNNCYSPVGTPVMVVTKNCGCYNDPNLSTAGLPVNHGITLLKRAGSDNGSWPMIRSSAHTVMESNTKGFVVTRIATADLPNITNPVEGMMVYDTTAKCLKIYADGAWGCFSTPACP